MGATTLSGSAAAVAVQEYATAGGAAVQTLTTEFTGSNLQTDSGTATSNGYLNSYGGYLAVSGSNTVLTTAGVAALNTKVAQSLDASGSVANRTLFPTGGPSGSPPSPFSGNNFRSVIYTGANTFYATGTSSGSPNTGGAWYFNGTNFTQLSTTVTNLRNVEIYNNQLYVSSASGAFLGISSVGSGLPTSSGQTTALQINMGTGASPYGFVMFDTNSDNTLDTAYIADDRTAAGGGLQKWTFNGSTWSNSWALLINGSNVLQSSIGAGFAGLRGLTGTFSGGTATLYATTTETTNNRLVSIVDTGTTPTSATQLAAAGLNYVFRGTDFAPAPAVSQNLVVSSTSVSVNEGLSSTFTVKLSSQPASDVTVNVARGSGDTDLNVSGGGSLTFTSANWDTPQTVTLSAAQDVDLANGSAVFNVTSSGLTTVNVTATEADNDTQSLLVSPTSVSVTEGSTNTFAVRLAFQPASNVTVSVARVSGDSDLSGDTTLTFTTANWNTDQTVTLSAAEDVDVANGSAVFDVTSSGLATVSVNATEADNDTQSLVVSSTNVSVTEGLTNTFTVRLAFRPSADVTVNVARVSGDTDLTVSGGSSLTFTSANWDTPQTVTLAAAQDPDLANGSAVFDVTASGLPVVSVTGTEADNDTQALLVSPTSLNVIEGSINTFTVRLAFQPTTDVTVSVARASGDTDLSVASGASLTFTAGNWDAAQTVTIAAAEDSDSLSNSALFEVTAAGILTVNVSGTEVDNDTTVLGPGDIAFTAFQADNSGGEFAGDAFAFVLLEPVVAGTAIFFTDNGYLTTTNAFRTNENMLRWVAQTDLSAGTKVVFIAPGGAGPNSTAEWSGITPATGAVLPTAAFGLAGGGDNIAAIQNPTFGGTDLLTGTALAQITFGGTTFALPFTGFQSNGTTAINSHTALAPGLVDGLTAVSLAGTDNGRYNADPFGSVETGPRSIVAGSLNTDRFWSTSATPFTPGNTPATFSVSGSVATDLFINEVVFNPLNDPDTSEEYVELRGTPGGFVPANAFLVLIEGDSETGSETAPGILDQIFYIGGMQFGSNGYLVLRQSGSTYTVASGATDVVATTAGWGTEFSSRSLDIENGSVSVLLIQWTVLPVANADLDANDDGALDGAASSWTIRDGIGNIDGGTADTGYGILNTSGNGSGLVPAGSSLINLSGYHPDYMARNGNSTGHSLLTTTSSDWVVGELAGAMPNATLATGGFTRPAAYEGAALNHLGALNSFSAANGPPVAVDDNLSDIAEDSGNRSISIASLITNDSDPNGDTLSITAVTNAVGGTVSISGANVIFSPTLNFNGAASFEYTLSDGSLTDIGLVTFTITAVNDAPTAGTVPNITVRQGAADSNLDLTSVFSDLETPDALLIYSVSGNTNSALFTSVTISLGTLTLDYNAVVFGSSVITIRATDEGSSFVETSFTVTVNYTLQLLHLADAEAGLLASTTAPNLAALVDAFDDDFSQTLILAGGDNWIPGPFLAGGTDAAVRTVLNQVSGSNITGTIPIAAVDIAIHNELGVEVSAIGNHEFDLGSRVFRDSFTPGAGWVGANFVHVSANLNFSGDAELSSRFTNTLDGGTGTLIPEASSLKGRIAPSVVVTKGGEKIGIVGATTQLIESISSPSGTEVAGFPGGPGPNGETDNMDLLAAQLQPVIDELRAEGINKIILMSHLQLISNEQSLATKLNGVDIILSAGSNTRLGDSDDVAVVFPGHAANFANNYPLITAGTDGKTTVIINTDNEFTYLGRLVVEFDAAGDINVTGLADLTSINGAYAATTTNVAAAWAADGGLSAAFAEGTKGEEVADLTEAVAAVITAKDGNISGFTDVYLQGERATVRNQETNLGNLTADANAAALVNALGSAAPSTFVASLKNGGGIRAQIGTVSAPDPLTGEVSFLPPAANSAAGKPAGAVSQLDIENSLRFNNSLMAFDTTAAGLKAILEHGVALLGNQGRFPQIGGVRFSFDPSAAAGSRVRNIVLIDENDVVIAAIVKNGVVSSVAPTSITIVTLSFLANGGDGYPIKANGDNFRFLLTDGTLSAPINESLDFGSAANIPANILGEQTALFDYVRAAFPGPGSAYNQADTPITADTRIQNLSQRSDGVFPANSSPTNINLTTSSLAENAGANSVVGSFSAVDPNVDDTFTFSLPAGLNSNSLFNISGTSLRATGSFDFEAGASYTITARVTDSGGLTFDKQFTITITDVNEATFDGNIFYNTTAAAEKNFSPDQTGQRSMIRNVQAVFNGDVAIPAGPVTNSSFVLSRLGGSPMSIGLTVVSRIFSGGKTTVLLGFTSGTHSVSGSLNDGNYRLVIDYGVLGIDGDGNGQVGGLRTINFHRFFGDSDGDRDVDARDSANYRTGLRGNASWLALFDFDNDGVLLTGGLQDQQDKDAFFANFGRLLNSSL